MLTWFKALDPPMSQSRALGCVALGTFFIAGEAFVIGGKHLHGDVRFEIAVAINWMYLWLRGFWSLSGFDMTPNGKFITRIARVLIVVDFMAMCVFLVATFIEPQH